MCGQNIKFENFFFQSRFFEKSLKLKSKTRHSEKHLCLNKSVVFFKVPFRMSNLCL